MNRTTLAVLGAFTLTACASSKSADTTDAASQPATTAAESSIETKEVMYEADGVKMTGYLAWDGSKEGKRPGVLVVHEWWGHNDYARKRARMLAELGYAAFAVDMYGDGKQADHPKDAQKFMMEVMSNMQGAKARFLAAHEILKNDEMTDGEHIAAIGYCFGGAVVLNMARMGLPLDGVAAFHAGSLAGPTPATAGDVKGKVLVLHGGADPFVPAEQVTAFKEEMDSAGVDYEFVEYAGAKHAFTNPGATAMGNKFELPLAYDAEADAASWAKLESFLNEIF